jgi:hypothetical protein
MKEFILLLTGNIALSLFFALLFFAIVGVAINLLTSAAKRDQLNPATPEHFSIKFLISDNAKRIYANLLLIYVSIRFCTLIFELSIENKEVYLFVALLIGFCYDKLLEFWKQKSSFLKVRKEENENKPVG